VTGAQPSSTAEPLFFTRSGQAVGQNYDDDQLVALVAGIALINLYNRLNVIVQQPAGDYQPGQFG
jgi:alkylhydroperoxidase family enzyme